MKAIFLAATLFLSATAAQAMEKMYKIGDLMIEQITSFETPKSARAAAGHMKITNTGTADDRLIAVRADFPRVELHTVEEQDGVMKMMEMESGILVPAGGTVQLAPGGLHVMFMGVSNGPFQAGNMVPAELVFENAGSVQVMFHVIKRGEGHGHGHGHSHSHSHSD